MPLKLSVLIIQLLVSVCYSYAQGVINLQQALRLAKTNNPALKTERYNVSISQADVVSASLRPNPIASVAVTQLVSGNDFVQGSHWSSAINQQYSYQVSKTIQLPQQRRSKIETASLQVQSAVSNLAEIQRNVLLQVGTDWLTAWTIIRQLSLLYQARTNFDTLLKINDYRYQKQVISQTDLFRTQLLAQQFDLQIKTAEVSYKNSLQQLAVAIGRGADLQIDTTESLNYGMDATADSLMDVALQKRTDLIAAKSDIATANSNINLQKSLAIPPPQLGFVFNPQTSTSFTPAPYVGLVATVELPFFSRNQGEIQKSKIIKQQAEQRLASVRQQINADVLTAARSFTNSKQTLSNFRSLLDRSNTILNNVQYAYLHGGTTIIDFLEAQRSWLDTQQQYYDALQQYRQNYINLLFVTGHINELAQ